MVYTQHFCAKCGSDQIQRNGHSQGHARYQCKTCRHQARFVSVAVAKAAQYAQVDQLLGERNPQRSIERVTGVSRMSIAQRIKKALGNSPPAAAPAPEKRLGSARTRRAVHLCGAQKPQGLALAGRRAGQPAHRGLDAGQPGPGHDASPLSAVAPALPAALLVLHR